MKGLLDRVLVEAGDGIPAEGGVIEDVALVNDSGIGIAGVNRLVRFIVLRTSARASRRRLQPRPSRGP